MPGDVVQAQYEQLDDLARRFEQQAEATGKMSAQVRRSMAALQQGGWVGKGSAAFTREMSHEVLPALQRLESALAEGKQTTLGIAQIMRQAEDDAAAPFLGRDIPLPLPARMNVFDLSDLSDQEINNLLFQYSGLVLAGGPGITRFLDFFAEALTHRIQLREFFRLIGRIGNILRGRPGMIGTMDELYQMLIAKPFPYHGLLDSMLRSPWFGLALAATDGALGYAEDMRNRKYGNDWLMAAEVNTTDAGIQFAISLHPYGKIALLINAANQIVGDIKVGGLRWYADSTAENREIQLRLGVDADDMAAAYKKMDLTNITKALAEGIVGGYRELFTPHSNMANAYWEGFRAIQKDPSMETMTKVVRSLEQTRQDQLQALTSSNLKLTLGPTALVFTNAGLTGVGNTLKATGDVIDGFIDSRLIGISATYNIVANEIASKSQYLSVSDEMKRRISDAAIENARLIQNERRTLTNLVEF